MSTSHESSHAEDIDLQTLGRAVWRAKGWILSLAIGAAILTYVVLSMMRPLYTSEARIIIQNDESAYTRPTAQLGAEQVRALDEQAIQSQVQVLTSRDLAVAVIKALDLTDNSAFEKDGVTGIVGSLLKRIGIAGRSAESEQEKAANTFAEHLSVFQLAKSSVIAAEYSSGDPTLAAAVANKLADTYLDWQREAKLEQTKDATAWLNAQIEVLRPRVAESEAAAEQFRASQGLFAGTNNVTLNAQQLSELNSQLILAKAQRSETQARARLIKKMLTDKSDIDATPEVMKSELIARLIDQRVQVQRQLAELSATLLPSHPRMQQLRSELADVRTQIRIEATKILKSLENEAEVAAARENSLRNDLNEMKTQASGLSEAEIKLRALEREAKAQRDLLESYLARYRDASARHDMGAVPAQAAIVSRAHASILPSFPKKLPISLLVAAAVALLSLAYVMARELIAAPAAVAEPVHRTASRRRRRVVPEEPEPAPAVASPPIAVEPKQAVPPEAAAALGVASPQTVAEPKEEPAPEPAKTVVLAAEQPPSRNPEPQATSSGAGFLARLRRNSAPTASTAEPAPSPAEGWLGRIQRARNPGPAPVEPAAPEAMDEPMPLKTNDLRHYLNQRLAAAAAESAEEADRNGKPTEPRTHKVGPTLKSLDAVINHIMAAGRGGVPRALLVAGAAPRVDSAREAIAIGRALVEKGDRVVLVDLSRGASAVSSPLELPRAPGLTDLLAGRSSFEDIVKLDPKTALQVIPAGNPKLAVGGDENERFARVFEALTQAYDCIAVHADLETVRKFAPALRFELPVAVAVLPAGEDGGEAKLTDFSALGCPVLVYAQDTKPSRRRLFGRVATI